MLWLAHDGSINADWLSHYAIRFGLRMPAKEVRALFVEDGSLSAAEFRERCEFLRHECALAGVRLLPETLWLRGSVADTLIARIPAGPESLVICGVRSRHRRFGGLAGTVSERLLASRRFNVLALHIVHPNTMGNPHRLLVPIMGHPRGFGLGVSFVKLLGEGLERVDVLLVQSPASSAKQRSLALGCVDRVKTELRTALDRRVQVDGAVLVGSDPANEIVTAAKLHRSQLICLGATERSAAERLVLGTPAERILRGAPCDVAIYRGVP